MAEFTLTQIVVLILVVLTIVVAAVFWIKPDLLNWIKGLPTYNVSDQLIDMSKLDKDPYTGSDLIDIGFFSNYNADNSKNSEIYFYYYADAFNGNLIINKNNKEKSPYYMNNKFVIYESVNWLDDRIGIIRNGKIRIDYSYLFSDEEKYKKLKYLEGAYAIKFDNQQAIVRTTKENLKNKEQLFCISDSLINNCYDYPKMDNICLFQYNGEWFAKDSTMKFTPVKEITSDKGCISIAKKLLEYGNSLDAQTGKEVLEYNGAVFI